MNESQPTDVFVATELAPRRQIFAWAMYDFANSGYTTVVLTAIFNAYFVKVVAAGDGGSGHATFLWTLCMAIANFMVLASAPALGAIADFSAHKKRFLAVTTVGCVGFTALLATVGPGDVALAMTLVILATLMFSAGENFIAAFLPEISPPEHMGRISGYGWALGYVGGLLILALCLGYITYAEGRGLGASHYVPVTMLITASGFALAALPTFLWLPERAIASVRPAGVGYLAIGLAQVGSTLRHVRRYQDLLRSLLAMTVYHCGIYTVIVLAAVYAHEVMGFKTADTVTMIMVVNVTAAVGAFFFGRLQDRFGSVRSLMAILLVWIVALGVVLAYESRTGFWAAANLIGIALGGSQAGGRALIGLFAPAGHSGEFFGLWGLSIKLAAIIGPMAYGSITALSRGSHQSALFVTGGFFVVGLLVLMTVDEARGRQAATPAVAAAAG